VTDRGSARDPAFVFLAAPTCSSYITGEIPPIIGVIWAAEIVEPSAGPIVAALLTVMQAG
jgi:hypothetical protein